MALSGSSTLAEAISQYKDNANWIGSPDKAALALEAIRHILLSRPSQLSVYGSRSLTYASLLDEKKRLEEVVMRVGSSASSARASFVRARGVPL